MISDCDLFTINVTLALSKCSFKIKIISSFKELNKKKNMLNFVIEFKFLYTIIDYWCVTSKTLSEYETACPHYSGEIFYWPYNIFSSKGTKLSYKY